MPVHPILGNTATMKKRHAEIIQKGERRMPRKGEVCDMSCQFAFACANYNENQPCEGFQLLSNGKLAGIIRGNLEEYERKSIERYIDMIQMTEHPRIASELATVVYRSLKPPKKKDSKKYTMIGYERYIINENGSLSIPEPTPTPKTPKSTTSQEELLFHSRNQTRIMKRSDEKR